MGCSPEGSAGPGFSWSAAWGAQSFLGCRLRGLGVSWGANGRPLGLGIEFWRAFESWGTMWGLQRSLGCSPGGSLCASQPHLSPSQARGPCSRDPQGAAGGMGQWEPWWGQQGRPGGLGEGTQAADTPLPLWGGGRAPGAPAHLSQENLPTRVLRCSQTIRSFQRFASQPLGADPPDPVGSPDGIAGWAPPPGPRRGQGRAARDTPTCILVYLASPGPPPPEDST